MELREELFQVRSAYFREKARRINAERKVDEMRDSLERLCCDLESVDRPEIHRRIESVVFQIAAVDGSEGETREKLK